MKALCHICDQVFEVAKVSVGNGSGIEEGDGFVLLPSHDAVPGKPSTAIVSDQTGAVLREICDGSLRPPEVLVH